MTGADRIEGTRLAGLPAAETGVPAPDPAARTRARPVTRVGLLECDHVAERHRGVAGDYVDMFRALFAVHAPHVELVPFDVVGGELPAAPDACDGWLCTGSRHSVGDDLDWIPAVAGFVRRVHDAGVPFAGVCFGHQLLAHALGGRVVRARSGWGAGIRRVGVDGHEPWMDPPASTLRLHFMHQDQVEVPPPGAVVLGRADHCPVALMRVGASMIGVQAHPEFTAAYADALLADRVARIGEAEVAAARAGLRQLTDEATLARWLGRVLAGDGR
jgi:GMP synthase-like glutamine amidotransferase